MQIMAPLRHENLVRLYGGVWGEGADKLCIVLEYCANGSLTSFLTIRLQTEGTGSEAQQDAGAAWEEVCRGLALGVAKCLSYLHHDLNEPLIHRDIKPENVLVSHQVVAKVRLALPSSSPPPFNACDAFATPRTVTLTLYSTYTLRGE